MLYTCTLATVDSFDFVAGEKEGEERPLLAQAQGCRNTDRIPDSNT